MDWVLGPGFRRYLKGFYEQIPAVYVPTSYMITRMKEEWGYGESSKNGYGTLLHEWGRGIDMNIFSSDRRSQPFR